MVVKQDKKEKKQEPSFLEKRKEKLNAHINAICKAYGDGFIKVVSEYKYQEIQRLSSGILTLDYALGGGWPTGRIIIISGPRSSCKTRLAISAICEAQKRSIMNGKYLIECDEEDKVPFSCLYIDAEGVFSPSWAKDCGVDLEALHFSKPTTLEQASETLISATTSGAYDLIILDSLAQMMVEDDIEAATDEKSFGTASAKKNNATLRKIQALMNKMEQDGEQVPTVMIINQEREKIGVPSYLPAHMKKSRPGGIAQEYVSSVIVETWAGKVEYFDEKKEMPAKIAFGFHVDKNKTGTPKVDGEFVMAIADAPNDEFKKGEILEAKVVWDYCEKFELIRKAKEGEWVFRGESYKTKKAIYEKYFLDKTEFALVKKEILNILCPKK